MPRLFHRRYMRGLQHVGTTERLLAILCPVLALGVACGFMVHGFAGTIPAPAPSAPDTTTMAADGEWFAASQWLPDLSIPGLRAVGGATAHTIDAPPDVLRPIASELAASEVGAIYQRTYAIVSQPECAISASVCDASSRAKAVALAASLRPAGATSLGGLRDGWVDTSARRAGYERGRYYSELQMTDCAEDAAPWLERLAGALADLVVDGGPPTTAEEASRAADGPFPPPDVPGWQAPARAERFSPDDLYVKIDGRADAYLQYQVRGLAFGTYTRRGGAGRTIDVYLYDMGEAANAYGMYQSEAPAEAGTVAIGVEGYAAGGAVFFCKASFYVQVLPVDAVDADVALAIARRLADAIADVGDASGAIDVLPRAGRIPGTPTFIAQDAFGYRFLTKVCTAEYQLDAGRVTLFVHRAATADEAGRLFGQYQSALADLGAVLWRDEAAHMVAGEVGGLVDVVFVQGRYLGGVAAASDVEVARRVAVAFQQGVPRE